jgi:hypothetical protein
MRTWRTIGETFVSNRTMTYEGDTPRFPPSVTQALAAKTYISSNMSP